MSSVCLFTVFSEEMAPSSRGEIQNLLIGSRCSPLKAVKEVGSVVTWGGPEDVDGFTVLTSQGCSRKMLPGGPEGFDGFPSRCCSVVVLGMLDLSCNGSESFWKVVFFSTLVWFSGTGGFITRGLLPCSEILNLPDDSALPVAVPNGIDGSVTNKMTFAVLEGSAAYPMKYPDYYAVTFYSYLAVAPAPC